MKELTGKQQADLNLLHTFIGFSCRSRHGGAQVAELPAELSGVIRAPSRLCPDCADLLTYAVKRLRFCPLDPKPACKKCPVHCYRPEYRDRIREIMAWSGKRLILRGRFDLIRRYFF